MKVPFAIHADTNSLLEKIHTCHKNLEQSSTTKVNKYTGCGYSLFKHFSFDSNKDQHDYYRGKDCMKNFCKDLRKHATEIKKMSPLKFLSLKSKCYH